MPECCHYGCHENSTLVWVVGWDAWTEELTCTVCKEVFGIRLRSEEDIISSHTRLGVSYER